jgi:hypothetical protein
MGHRMIFELPMYNLNERSIPWILSHMDRFVRKSEYNESVEEVILFPYAFEPYAWGEGQDDEKWDTIGQAIGNLQGLKKLLICVRANGEAEDEDYDNDDDLPNPVWKVLARILSKVRQKIEVELTETYNWDDEGIVEESGLFARAIHGHPTITSFIIDVNFPSEYLDVLYSALSSMPALESIKLCQREVKSEDEFTRARNESLTELLRAPPLRSVYFDEFSFTSALCQATAKALMGDTGVTKLEFNNCLFPDEKCATNLTNGFSRNTSVTSITAAAFFGNGLNGALAAALPSNSTLRDLSLVFFEHDVSPIILALGKNTGLKTVSLDRFAPIDESLCTAMKDGLGMNATLESLNLSSIIMTDDNAAMWCRAFSFLRTNKTLKSLVVAFDSGATKSCVSAFRIDILAMLQENASLEILSILSKDLYSAEEHIAFVAALQDNTTLKTLTICGCGVLKLLTDDEDKQMASVLKKNYALESLPDIDLETDCAGDVGAVLRLNGVGRRYLIEDGSSIAKGVEVLSAVSDKINCVFLHLLENPRLCDRSAVEKVSVGESNGSWTNSTDGSGGGKRERASIDGGKTSHRRLA